MVEQKSSKVAIISASIILAVVISITAAGVFLTRNKYNTGVFPRAQNQKLLASVFNNQEEYSDIFSRLQKPAEDANADAGIISHHFLAKQLIADFYNKVGSDKISTVLLLSPDHYNNYFQPEAIAYTSYLNWATPFGELQTDGNLIKSLVSNGNIEIKDSAMGLEHGIYVEVPFIRKFFPNARIVPLVLRNNLSADKFLSLGETLKKISGGNSILIVSSDFSHNASIERASENDTKSINALRNLSVDNISEITNDCKQCIATLSGFLNKSQDSFFLNDNKNSFDISGQDENSVTSYVAGYYAKKRLRPDFIFRRYNV